MFEGLRFLPAALVLLVVSFPAQSADDIKPPPPDYRQWFHVNTMVVDKASPLFEGLGGMQNVYINTTGEAALKKGGPYPNKSMFVTDLHDFTIADGSYVEGARKGIAVMVKDAKKYAATGGWGFAFFDKDGKPVAEAAMKSCSPCHAKASRDFVFTQYAPTF